jgi:tetratricopeptide (TPR) repeat protein
VGTSLAEDLKNPVLIRDSANHLGNYYLATGDLVQAEKWYTYTEKLPQEMSEVLSEYYRLGGTIAKREGNYEQALENYNRALETDNTLKEPTQIGINYYLQGSAYSLMGNYNMAVDSLLTALEKDRFYENLPGIAADLSALAQVMEKSDRLAEALIYYKRAYLAWKGLNREEKTEEIILKIEIIGGEKMPR